MHNLSAPLLRVNAGGVSTKDTGKYPEIPAALDPTKRFFRFKESRGSPAQSHVGIAIAANTPTDATHSTIRILDDVGGAKQRINEGGSFMRLTVNVSSNPSSRLAAASEVRLL